MASAAMEEFEHQFASISAEITTKINKIPQLTGNEKKQLSSSAERQIDEARELLEQMDLEVRTIPSSDRQKYSTRLRSYEAELTRLEKDLRKAKIAFRDGDASREELLGIDDPRNSEDQRARLLDNTERLERSGKKLEAGYRMTIETGTFARFYKKDVTSASTIGEHVLAEELGQGILENLHKDREKIQRSRARLRETDAGVGQSSRVLSGMMR
ncbi:vesicle transport through interaction with t-SNAREs homolog 1A-like isoform X3 [Acanthaster planci]|nr:vesicle transport through interaction with t-SNAREs homolog 1A-like isoform X3 [Acanthaster planci]